MTLAVRKTTNVDQRAQIAAAVITSKLMFVCRHWWPDTKTADSLNNNKSSTNTCGMATSSGINGREVGSSSPKLPNPPPTADSTSQASSTNSSQRGPRRSIVTSTDHPAYVGRTAAKTAQQRLRNRCVSRPFFDFKPPSPPPGLQQSSPRVPPVSN
ncbi:TPA: hypothetical protein N0F65_002661 [Lagenidium giganteum]|uniref:Uncharacterized protein n=1 Tax=Lagenidium giganteum TaxID=4803 RepID=A0AAV2Z439_9STRA|nr:TPA: hypothetical protein N0F65_002661 [Lagenidium giganteum]